MNEPVLLQIMSLLDEANVPGRDVVDQVKTLIADRDNLDRQLQGQSRKSDYERLLEALDEDRSEVLQLLADCALDHALLDEARGWGWLAAHRRWPVRLHSGVWHWTTPLEDRAGLWSQGRVTARDAVIAVMSHAEHCLPPPLHDVVYRPLLGRGGDGFGWRSAGEALRAVVDVIAQGKWSSGVAGPAVPGTGSRATHAVVGSEDDG